ncbi:MAG: hypothetical protein DRG83_06235 [Deltaproteobacteria bacterium]|nr:MAG: hypothetical protein DRG83_06235 [Deltaproteobacteria bacterium]
MEYITLVLLLLGLFILGVPVGIAFIATAIVQLVLFTDVPLMMVAGGLFSKLDSFPLEAVLFFILLGNIMQRGDSARRLVELVKSLVGRMWGGLGIVAAMTCGIFGAISGSATATVAAIGPMMVPMMREAGYEKDFALGLLTTAGILGVIVPPSILMILYALVANVSIAALFLGGFVPGAVIIAGLSVYSYMVSRKRKYGRVRTGRRSQGRLLTILKDALPVLALPVLVLGGIYGGIFTPTEAAVAGCVYALCLELVVYRSIGIRMLIDAFIHSGITTGALLITLAGACIFSDYLTIKLIPQQLAALIGKLVGSRIGFLILVNVLFLFLGTFIDPLTAIIIVPPLLIPAAQHYHVDLIFLGVILAVNLGIGYVTPPLGANLFIASVVFREPFTKVARAVVPTLLLYMAALALFNVCPWLVMALPRAFY